MGVAIKSFGHYISNHSITNAELAERLGISEKWILEKTGIHERQYFTEGATSDMIVHAANSCIQKAGISAAEIDCVIVATMTPDHHCPSTASIVAQKLETRNAWGFDVVAACTGYLYGMQVARALITSKSCKTVLLCGADMFSTVINPLDRRTVLLFADGAGATLLQHSKNRNDIDEILCSMDTTYNMDISIPVGGSKTPLTESTISDNNHFVKFEDKRIYENGVALFERAISDLIGKTNCSLDAIDFIVPHQANKRMIESVATKFGLPISKFIISIEHTGNTGAATIPITVSQALESGKLKGNERLLLVSVGAGFTCAAGVINLNLSAMQFK
jgi:3-oxoacyl-[acyl-carrier-protein] synthase-3